MIAKLNECVIDSDLLERFQDGGSHPYFLDFIETMKVNPSIYSQNDIYESELFVKLLDKIVNAECKLVVNDEIKEKYYKIIYNCPGDLTKLIDDIFDNDDCYNYLPNKALVSTTKDKIKHVPIAGKLCFVDAAHQCSYHAIITTERYFITLLDQHRILIRHCTGVSFKKICELIKAPKITSKPKKVKAYTTLKAPTKGKKSKKS